MEESFFRNQAISRECRRLPAAAYNLTRTLLMQCGKDCLFVPIRSMQYMAIIDRDEIIFVERIAGHEIELAWQDFNPHGRVSLDDPVPYRVVYYLPQGPHTMKRLQGEFYKAMRQLADRRQPHSPAKVIPFSRR